MRPHPLTGPIFIKGARPGDLLEIEYLDIIPQSYGWTRILPGSGFLRDLFADPYLVHWELDNQWAVTSQLPSVRIPNASFMGTAGLGPFPGRKCRNGTDGKETCANAVVRAMPPDPVDAVPTTEPVASQGLRTLPPRENGGNMDAKQLTKGSRLMIPVNVEGGLFSVGDAHYAQGDSECCLTAIEMGGTAVVRFRIHKGEAEKHNINWPRFAHPGYFCSPEWAAPRNFIATMGVPLREDGTQECGDVTLGGPQRHNQHDRTA